MAGRRSNGEGTAYYNEARQRWEAQAPYKDAGGQPKRKKFTGKTQKEVNRKKKEFLDNLEDGLLPEADKLTVGVWLDRWLADFVKPRVRTKTYEKYESCIKSYIKPKFKDVLLKKLAVADVQRVFNEMGENGGRQGKGLSSLTIRNTRRVFSMALDKAIKLSLLLKNPVKLTDPPRLEKMREIKPLTADQANTLLQIAKKDAAEVSQVKAGQKRKTSTTAADYDTYVAVAIALNTGMRLGEVLGLKWDDIHHEQKIITVKRAWVSTSKGMKIEDPKTGKGRKILIDDALLKVLSLHQKRQSWDKNLMGNLYKDNQWIIGGQYGENYESKHFSSRKYKSLLAKAGIEDTFTFHDLRHTHATILLLKGVNPKIVQERLGHATISMTLDTYSHLLPDNQDKAVEVISSCLAL
ncbi:tyrosine-type recombinase/integrase [Acetonema longum]|uniref:Phage integrase n=1 Tax=Acetonema longum DSM 6540 TaxID=1009370 RepID=F7NEJ7_9FIRM|nr:tyrosine-type recombinase/integrase [Acetonema longum]EGO65408.1 Phage integrase [Acetonema longum DSM 6540]